MEAFAKLLRSHRAALRDAAVDGAARLGVFSALEASPADAHLLARRLGVVDARRLRTLLEVLSFEGLLRREGDRFVYLAPRPPAQKWTASGSGAWGRIDEILRSDEPDCDVVEAIDREGLRRYQEAMAVSATEPARELTELLLARAGAGKLLDIGGGVGTYARAWIAAAPVNRARNVDHQDVLSLAPPDPRIERVPGDALQVPLERGHRIVLLSNVLHHLSPERCRTLLRRATDATAPGGLVVVKELPCEDDRSGPAEAVYFALDLALHTREGDVHPPGALAAWMREAGLEPMEDVSLRTSPECSVLVGRRPDP